MKAKRKPARNLDAVPISEIVSRVMQKQGWSRMSEHRAVFEAWQNVVPKTIGQRTRAVSFRGGRLIVIVESAPLMQELYCFRQSEFLTLLNQYLVNNSDNAVVQRIEFRRS
jgi:predicted nucleic acid-binding Zn ribbon protein